MERLLLGPTTRPQGVAADPCLDQGRERWEARGIGTRPVLSCVLVIVLATVAANGCATDGNDGRNGGGEGQGLDPTPTKLDGTESQEFESEDIERAEGASEAVQEYCSGAVSEAQELGCLSHVEEGDVP